MKKIKILNSKVNVISFKNVINLIDLELKKDWNDRNGRYISLCNVHMCMEAYEDHNYCQIVNDSHLVLPDGKPLYWYQKLSGHKDSEHIRGTDLTFGLCNLSNKNNYSIGFYGSTPETLENLKNNLKKLFPKLKINYLESPPFREITDLENKLYIEKINNLKLDILFVGLGCPKQEIWMSLNAIKTNTIMLGVGAAFDFIAKNKIEAPLFLQKIGLEWLFRMLSEPSRLWKRYLINNTKFILYITLKFFRR